MMTTKEILVRSAVVLTTLLDMEKEGFRESPASSFYLAFDMNMEVYNAITLGLQKLGWIHRTSSTLALTDEGRKKAQEIEART